MQIATSTAVGKEADSKRRRGLQDAETEAENLYMHLVTRNVGMIAIMIFVRRDTFGTPGSFSTSLASAASPKYALDQVEVAELGVGVQEMGNKGAVGVRFTVENHAEQEGGKRRLTFVGAHLAPHEEGVGRRNHDWVAIARGLVFARESLQDGAEHDPINRQSQNSYGSCRQENVSPLRGPGSSTVVDEKPRGLYHDITGDEDPDIDDSYTFVAGDLNYRSCSTKPGQDDHKTFPQPDQDDDEDEERGQYYQDLLLYGDQLRQELVKGSTLHGFLEPEIHFPPSYKLKLPSSTDTPVDEIQLDTQVDNNKIDVAEVRRTRMKSRKTQKKWDWAVHRWPSWCDRILYHHSPSTGRHKPVEPIIHTYTALPQPNTSDHRPVAMFISLPFSSSPSASSFPSSSSSSSSSPSISLPVSIRSPIHPSHYDNHSRLNDTSNSTASQPHHQPDDESHHKIVYFPLNPYWHSHRLRARRKEVVVGILAYLTLTAEGVRLLLLLLFAMVLLGVGLRVRWSFG